MSITADPLFVAAEVQWRTERLSTGPARAVPARAVPARHHGSVLRTALRRVRHPHGDGRHTTTHGAPRVA